VGSFPVALCMRFLGELCEYFLFTAWFCTIGMSLEDPHIMWVSFLWSCHCFLCCFTMLEGLFGRWASHGACYLCVWNSTGLSVRSYLWLLHGLRHRLERATVISSNVYSLFIVFACCLLCVGNNKCHLLGLVHENAMSMSMRVGRQVLLL